MDVCGWILLAIVAVCVIALIVIGKKREALEADPVVVDGKDSGRGSTVKPVEKTVPVPAVVGPPQVTIYEFKLSGKLCLCPHCDGENNAELSNCHICGHKLK